MNTIFRKTLVTISSILLIFLCLPLERPYPSSNYPIIDTVETSAYSLLSDELELEICRD